MEIRLDPTWCGHDVGRSRRPGIGRASWPPGKCSIAPCVGRYLSTVDALLLLVSISFGDRGQRGFRVTGWSGADRCGLVWKRNLGRLPCDSPDTVPIDSRR